MSTSTFDAVDGTDLSTLGYAVYDGAASVFSQRARGGAAGVATYARRSLDLGSPNHFSEAQVWATNALQQRAGVTVCDNGAGTRYRLYWQPNNTVRLAKDVGGEFVVIAQASSPEPSGATFRLSVDGNVLTPTVNGVSPFAQASYTDASIPAGNFAGIYWVGQSSLDNHVVSTLAAPVPPVVWVSKNGSVVTRPDGTFYRVVAEGTGNLDAESSGTLAVPGGAVVDVSIRMRRAAGVGHQGQLSANIFAGAQYLTNVFVTGVPSQGTEFATLTGRLDLTKYPNATSVILLPTLYNTIRLDAFDIQPDVSVVTVGSAPTTEAPTPPPPAVVNQAATGVYQSVPGSGVFSPLRTFAGSFPAAHRVRLYRASLRAITADTSRDRLVPGTYTPDASNTGLVNPALLTNYTGTSFLAASGAVYENLRFNVLLNVAAANVIFRNCLFRGAANPTTDNACVYLTNAAGKNVLFEDCEVDPQTPNLYNTGIYGGEFTARRVKLHNLTDYFGLNRPNVRLEGCWGYDFSYFSPSANQPGDNQTHNDAIQFHPGVSGVVLKGNRWTGKYGSAGTHQPSHRVGPTPSGAANPAAALFMFGNNLGANAVVGLDSQDDIFEGGFQPVNGGGPAGLNIGKIWRGRFDGDSFGGPDMTGASRTIDVSPDTIVDVGEGTANQNVYANGTPVLVRRNQ